MIDFCPPGAPIMARRVLENVLRSLGVQQVRAGGFLYSRRHAFRPYPRANWFTSTEVVYGVTGTEVTVLPEYGVSP